MTHAWVDQFAGAITVCAPDGIILEMNERAAASFSKDGGAGLIGSNLYDCHPEPARSKLRDLMASQTANVYSIEKKGVHKIIYQSPWYTADGSYGGFVELSFETPAILPHFIRRSPLGAERRDTSLEPGVVRPAVPAVEGWALDIGGGGEGVMGRLLGSRTVAIDLLDEELRDAPAGPLKLRMDARALQFLENSFDLVTAFYSLLFAAPADHALILREAARVLRPGGVCCIWDAQISANPQAQANDVLLTPLTVLLPDETITTCYGVAWQGRSQSAETFSAAAVQAGLEVVQAQTEGAHFYLQLRKPLP
jgi:SAM-dependent methyltransferase